MFAVRRCFHSCHAHAHTPRRFTHRAPDYAWIQEGSKYAEFKNQFGFQGEAPELMKRYLKVASVCIQKDKYCFVHAQSASFRFPIAFFEELRGKNPNFFRYLRYPSPQFNVSHEEIMAKIKEYVEKHGNEAWSHGMDWHAPSRPDLDKSLRPFLVSLSYTLAQCGSFESASDFLFRNSSISNEKAVEQIIMDAVTRALKCRGKEGKIPQVMETYKKLDAEYSSLKWGNAFVIGVPKQLSGVVYDCKSFGIPTGIPIDDAIATAHQSSRAFTGVEGGAQARFIVCKQTLDPNSGIDVVDVTNADEVQRYREGYTFTSPEEIGVYQPYFNHPHASDEQKQIEKRKQLDDEVKALAHFITSKD